MATPPTFFTLSDDGAFLPSEFALSRWGDDMLNGPAIVGLAARALEHQYGSTGFLPARLTVDLFKAARRVPTTTSLRLVRDGRRVRNTECEVIQQGLVVARAVMVQYRVSAPPPGQEWFASIDFEHPSGLDDSRTIMIGSDGHGWTETIAEHTNVVRKRFYQRSPDVVAGEQNTPFVRAVTVGEATSLVTNLGTRGVGYINGDLTVALSRLPQGEWIGVQADSHWADDGVAVGGATLFDVAGAFGSGLVTAISNPAAQLDFSADSSTLTAEGLRA
jgi:hypothetical protein